MTWEDLPCFISEYGPSCHLYAVLFTVMESRVAMSRRFAGEMALQDMYDQKEEDKSLFSTCCMLYHSQQSLQKLVGGNTSNPCSPVILLAVSTWSVHSPDMIYNFEEALLSYRVTTA